MTYVQALWRGVERDRSEDAEPRVAGHPFFGRLSYYDGSDRDGHWEAVLSHPRTAERYTVCLPGGPDTPLHFSAFRPDYRMRDRPPTRHDRLIRAYGVLGEVTRARAIAPPASASIGASTEVARIKSTLATCWASPSISPQCSMAAV